MPADTTETVAEHSARLQPSINLHVPVTAFHAQLLWYPMYYPGGMKARESPVQWSKPHRIVLPTQDSNPGGRIQNHKRWPLHYHCCTQSSLLKISICSRIFGNLVNKRFQNLWYTYHCQLWIITKLQIQSLEHRRLVADLVTCFNIIHGFSSLLFSDFF